MIKAADIYGYINTLAPYSMQEGYDNSGLNVGSPDSGIKKVLVALDVTNEVVEEAVRKGADMVITHHPVIFRGLKQLDPKQPAVALAVNGICALSMHTNFDAAEGGMNDLLCRRLGLVPSGSLDEENGISIGCICDCEETTARELALKAKESLGCRAVRVSCADKKVTRVGVCSGSGGSFMKAAIKKGCDVLVTGDVKHDIFIDSHNAGLAVIDAGHYYTENIFFEYLKSKLSEKFPELEISEAESNTDITETL